MSARRRILPIFVPHAGCPNDCVFCNQKRISGSLLPASAETVLIRLSELPEDARCELAFYGGSFTAIDPGLREELLGAARPFLERGTVESIRVSTRPDAVDSEVLASLARAGVKTVELGAQSMSDRVLRLSGRGHTSADTVRAAALVREAGLVLILQMMTGLPGSDPAADIDTARKLIALRPDGVRIYPTVVVRDTALETLWRSGRYREHTVEDAVEVCAKILPLFETASIPVIRLGLNPTDELSGGAAVAGAYHPALGELVRSRVLRCRAERLLLADPPTGPAELWVSRRDCSAMIGRRRENVLWLKERFPEADLRVRSADVPDGTVRVVPL